MAEATTTPVTLTRAERHLVAQLLLAYPKEKMNVSLQSKLLKAWNRLNLPDDWKETKKDIVMPNGEPGYSVTTAVVGDRTEFELTEGNIEFLVGIPCDYPGAVALVMGGVHEKLNDALAALKKAG